MALQKKYKLKNGLVVSKAYIKVSTITSTKDSASALVSVYVDKDHANTEPVHRSIYLFKPDYTDDAENVWKQAYEFLKTIPEFEGAKNV